MILARSLLFFAAFSLNTLLYAVPLVLVGWLFPFEQRARFIRTWGIANLWLLRNFCRLQYEVEGMENLPERPSIVMAKHQSTWETIALRALLPFRHTWVLKRELLWVPFFGWALALFRPIAIDRKSGRKAVRKLLTEGKRALEAGLSVVIFPEGTRVAPGLRKRYGIGGAMLAAHTGAPIVPIAHNAGVFWRRRDLKKYPGTIRVVIGKAMETAGLSPAEISASVEQWIEGQMGQLPGQR